MQKKCFSYPVEFVKDVFGKSTVLADLLKKVTGAERPKVLIVADMNVVQRTEGLGTKIGRYVQSHGIQLAGSPVVIAGGEKIKADNLQSALKVMSAVLAAKLGRNDVVLAIGGGTILDVAGYAAAQVRGGVQIVRMPTTPAAMMDAAFADYAAIDSANVKDALRVPSVPAAVVIDVGFAASVLDGVWRGGIGEAVRLAMACDATLAKDLAKMAKPYHDRDMSVLEEVLSRMVATRLKKGATSFAQWAAPRLESMSGYKLPHGYAVSIGICVDLDYAVEKGMLKPEHRDMAVTTLRECGALDGLNHSWHLLNQVDNLLHGLDAWTLSSGTTALLLPVGVGKTKEDAEVDRAVFVKVLKKMVSSPAA